MRVTVSHHKPKEEVVRSIDRSFDDLVQGISLVPLKIVDENRNWQGSLLTFSFTAKMGILGVPVRGTINVTDADVIVDVELGLIGKLLGQSKVQQALTSKVRGLLK